MILRRVKNKILSSIRGGLSLDKLKKRGLKIGHNFSCQQDVIIDPSHCQHIMIGDNVTFAPRVHVLAHDASTKNSLGYTKVKNVKIGNNVFIGAGSIVLCGDIGDNVIIGAGSVVVRNIPTGSVAVGCPARVICSFETYINKEKTLMNEYNCYDEQYTFSNEKFTEEMRNELVESCDKYGGIFLR